MPKQIKAIVITGNGTNCEMEMAHACRLAGFDTVEIVHISELLFGRSASTTTISSISPAAFSTATISDRPRRGQTGSSTRPSPGRPEKLFAQFTRFIAAGKLILGVCNGFQLLVKLGMLPGFDGITDRQTATLTFNDSGRFEDRWIHLRADAASPCVFTKGLKGLTLPVRHGEGKFVPLDEEILGRLHREHLICLQYSDERSERATSDYPANPNGSVDAIAGICNETGRIFGMMPHPEAFSHRTNHPRWTREELPEEGAGLAIFRNAAAFLRSGVF